MWDAQKSRGQYLKVHGRVEAEDVEALSPLIGNLVPDGRRSNFSVVAELITSVNVSNGRGRRSDGVYCGVARSPITAEAHATGKGVLGLPSVRTTLPCWSLSLRCPWLCPGCWPWPSSSKKRLATRRLSAS